MKFLNKVVVCTITIILLSAVFVPILHEYAPNGNVAQGWQYDDYRSVANVESVGGVMEIVDIHGSSYVHASDVGSGTITYTNGSVENITVSKAQLDLIYMNGQSNAAYRNADLDQVSPIPLLGNAYYYGMEDRSGPTAAENNTGMDINDCSFWSMLDDSGNIRIGDKAPSFSYEYTKSTGHKVYWVCGAVGNKALNTFLPTTGFMWNYGKALLADAISLVDTDKFDLNIQNYLWIQGEANAASDINSYKTQFLTMHNAMLSGEYGVKFKECFISIVRDSNGTNSAIAQRQLCAEYPTIHMGADLASSFTIENGLMGSDDLHYSQLGNNLIGKTLGESVGSYVAGDLPSVAGNAVYVLYAIPAIIIVGLILMMIPARQSE